MSKTLIMLASLIGLLALAGCAAKAPASSECGGNNCRHGYESDYSSDSYSSSR